MKKITVYFLAILLLFNSGVVQANSPTETPAPNLKLNVNAPQTINISDGTAAAVDITVSNPSNEANIYGLSVQAFIENPDKVYIDGSGYAIQNSTIDAGGSFTSGTFYINAEKDFSTKSVPIKLNLRYYVNNTFVEQDETIYVRVVAPERPVNPAIEITKSPAWVGSVAPSQGFEVPFTIRNTGDSVAKNIKVSLEGLESGKITLAKGLSTVDITSLESGGSTPIAFNLKSDPSTPAGSYMLTLKYSFVGEDTTKAPTEGSYSFTIDVLKISKTSGNLDFKNITFPTKLLSQNQATNISFDLVNSGKAPVHNVTVTATSQDQSGLASKSVSKIITKNISNGKSTHYSFDFISTPSAETRNYPVELKFSYKDDNDQVVEASQIVGVFVKAPKPVDPNAKDESSVPKLIIEEYSFTPEIIEAGSPFTMHLKLYNTNAKKSVRNIKIFLTSDAQESVSNNQNNSNNSQQNSSSNSSDSSSTASVFTPVGSSNTFYVDEIKPGKRVEKEITLTTVPDTVAKTYTVMANFEYEDSKANKYQATEQIGVPVVQKAKLDIGDVVPQGEFFVGQENPVTVDYFNTGKASLYNVMVKINGKHMKFDVPSSYKGNFSPGSSEQFTVSVTPEKAGKNKFEIEFSYEDSTGKKESIKREYAFDVQESSPMEPLDEVKDEGGFNPLFIIIPLLLIAAVAGVIFYKKHKNKQADEDLKL